MALAATKKYPTARLRRGILYAMTDVRGEDLRRPAAYVRLLGTNEIGRAFLSARRREGAIPVVTRRAELPRDAAALRQAELEERVYSLYTLCTPRPLPATALWRRSPLTLQRKDKGEPI